MMFNLFKKNSETQAPSSASSNEDFPRFVGFFTAHIVWQTEGGEAVVPLLAYQPRAGARNMVRVEADEYGLAASQAQEQFGKEKTSAKYALCALDGYITVGGEKLEAIIVEAYDADTQATAGLAIPYRSANTPEGLAIYRPKVSQVPGDAEAFLTAFWEGVDSHVEAAAFWDKYGDESK